MEGCGLGITVGIFDTLTGGYCWWVGWFGSWFEGIVGNSVGWRVSMISVEVVSD